MRKPKPWPTPDVDPVRGFVVITKDGHVYPGSFSPDGALAMQSAAAIAVLNRIRPDHVRVVPAELKPSGGPDGFGELLAKSQADLKRRIPKIKRAADAVMRNRGW